MLSFLSALLALTILSQLAIALTIVSPLPNSDVDPSKSITLIWTSSSSDPSSFDLHFDNPTNSLYRDTTIATGIQTSAGSYNIPANSLLAYGKGFELKLVNSGNSLASIDGLELAVGAVIQTSTQGEAESSASSPSTSADTSATSFIATPTSTSNPASISTTPTGSTLPTTTLYVSPMGTTQTSGISQSTGFITVTGTSTTKSSSGSITTTTSATASAASKGAAPSLQAGLNSWEMLFTAAGVFAGIIALIT